MQKEKERVTHDIQCPYCGTIYKDTGQRYIICLWCKHKIEVTHDKGSVHSRPERGKKILLV